MRRFLKTKNGFTLTELSFAIVFLSVLLLTIVFVTMDMTHTYHKGQTMKSVNTVGLELIDEFSSAISSSPGFDIDALCNRYSDSTKTQCVTDNAKNLVSQEFYITLNKNDNTSTPAENFPVQGVFCTGKYSYVWQTGYLLGTQSGFERSSNLYSLPSGNEGILINPPSLIRLSKYEDAGRDFCQNNMKDESNNNTYGELTNKLSATINAKTPLVSEFISSKDIAIYSFEVLPPIVDKVTGRALYSATLVLGSITGSINYNDASCEMDGMSTYDKEYCSAYKFNFTMRASGG